MDTAVGDLIMPLVGLALGLSLIEARKLGAVFAYGSFITVALNTRKSRPRHPYPLDPKPPTPLAQPFLSLPTERSPRMAEAGAGAGWR